ncbi:MAG: heat-inducible transcriptional repressor HrcA [Alphaproteobacteria bacterium]
MKNRAHEVLRLIIDQYMENGIPVASRTIAQKLSLNLSPATIRNIMADLEDQGLLFSRHVSGGRLPTHKGLRFFVDGLLQKGALTDDERQSLETSASLKGRSLEEMLAEAGTALSGLSGCAGVVLAPKSNRHLRHLEFVPLGDHKVLVIMVNDDGMVENRLMEAPAGITASSFISASNYLNNRVQGRSIEDLQKLVAEEIQNHEAMLDGLTSHLVTEGLAIWSGGSVPQLIVRGQSNLLQEGYKNGEIDSIKKIFYALETREVIARLLESSENAEGIQIYIGAENSLFQHTGCSLIISPYTNGQDEVVGAVGVIGPTRLNYARVIPMVDYTARVMSRLLGSEE